MKGGNFQADELLFDILEAFKQLSVLTNTRYYVIHIKKLKFMLFIGNVNRRKLHIFLKDQK
jgi:hypothetical protein